MHATRHLTERRADDREAMARILAEIAESAGASAIRPEPFAPQQVRLEIEAPGGAYLPLCFEGGSGRHRSTPSPTVWAISTAFISPRRREFEAARGI